MDNNKTILILSICIILLIWGAFVFLNPEVAGDSFSYLQTIDFLNEGNESFSDISFRFITTFGGLWSIIFFSKIFGDVLLAWLFMNVLFYIIATFVFYKLLLTLFKEKGVAFLGTLFLIGNYAILKFGLNFLMDIGGWISYIISIYFLLKYAESENKNYILFASLTVGIGGLFKEYAFLPIIPIAIFLIYDNRQSIFKIIKNSWLPTLLAVVPTFFVYSYTFLKFGYSYIDWLQINQETYVYSSRIIEYIKSLGSLLNLLGLLFLGGFFTLKKEWVDLNHRIKLFIISVFISILPIFFWPAITQRILFITVPFVVIVSSFFIKRYNKLFPVFVLVLFLYILVSFFMDSFLLKVVNLPF